MKRVWCNRHSIFGYFLFSDSSGSGDAPFRLQDRPCDRPCAVCDGHLFVYACSVQQGATRFFLLALFVIASGLGFLETGANPLIAQLGEPESAVRRLNFSQAFNPLGAISGALIGTLFIFSGVEPSAGAIALMKAQGRYDSYLHHETARVLTPYMVLGVIVLVWAFFILRTDFPSIAGEAAAATNKSGGYSSLLQYPHFLSQSSRSFATSARRLGLGVISSNMRRTTRTSRRSSRAFCLPRPLLHLQLDVLHQAI